MCVFLLVDVVLSSILCGHGCMMCAVCVFLLVDVVLSSIFCGHGCMMCAVSMLCVSFSGCCAV